MLPQQIKALIRKELRISKRNKKGTVCEMLTPFIIGMICALLIYLNTWIYDNLQGGDLITQRPNPTYWNGSWIGLVQSNETGALPQVLQHYEVLARNRSLNVSEFNTSAYALESYLADPVKSIRFPYVIETATSPTSSKVSLWAKDEPQVKQTQFSASPLVLLWQLLLPAEWEPLVMFTDASVSNMNYKLLFCMTAATFLPMAFLPSTIITAGRLVDEKVNKVKELLKVMGLKDYSYFGSHYLSALIRFLPGLVLIAASSSLLGAVEGISGFFLLFISCFFFALSTISFSFLMPVFFSRPVWSNVTCVIFLIMIPETVSLCTQFDIGLQQFLCLVSPVSFFYITMHVYAGDAFSSDVTFGFALGMLIVDAILYMALSLYLIQIRPGEFGVPKHPLFFISWMFSSSSSVKAKGTTSATTNTTVPASDRIVFSKLIKKYDGAEVSAVDGLNLKVHRGEIFALLGHNGAGKTTTMNMLTGLVQPTSYESAQVDGCDLESEIDIIRSNLGVCPQFDVLFGDLTAREHLELFAELRGLGGDTEAERINSLVANLELPDDGHTTSKKFSGGTKRRLSVGNALVGKNSLIILDEPSSGLDPVSRRKLWHVIKREKSEGRTVLLSTHFMEEADYLGDRIGIMSKGKMYCCGTSTELKHTYNCGYYLRVVRQDTTAPVADLHRLVQGSIPDAVIEDDGIFLPASRIAAFEGMLEQIEINKDRLGITSYGLSMNTLEDVFVTISKHEGAIPVPESHEANVQIEQLPPAETSPLVNNSDDDFEERVIAAQDVPLWKRLCSQIITLLNRRIYIFLRTRTLQVFFVAMPAFFILVAFLTIQKQAGMSGNNRRGPPQTSSFDNVPTDFRNLRLLYIDEANNGDSNTLAEAMKAVYPTIVSSFEKSAQLDLVKLGSARDYVFGYFVNTGNVAFNAIATNGVSGYYLTAVDFAKHVLNVTLLINPSTHFDNTAVMTSVLRQAFVRCVNGTNTTAIVYDRQTLPAGHGTPAPTGDGYSSSGQALYTTMILQLYVMISVVLIVSYSVVSVAEELKNRVYFNMRVGCMLNSAYWISNVAHDLVWCMLPFLLTVIGIYAKPVVQLEGTPIGALFLAFVLFVIQSSCLALCIAVWKQNMRPVMYVVIMEVLTLASTGGPYIMVLLLQKITDNAAGLDDWRPYLLSLTPACAFYHTFDTLSGYSDSNTDTSIIYSFDKVNGVGPMFVISMIELIIPVGLLYMFSKELSLMKSDPIYARPPVPPDDDDVKVEKQRVLQDKESLHDNVRCMDVVTVYGSGVTAKVAVNGVTFSIRRGECFGLLGPNGAGKTTLIKQLMGEFDCTSGAIAHGQQQLVAKNKDELYLRGRIGVCQQFDALWDSLTARQHMEVYLQLRLTTLYNADKDASLITKALDRVYLGDDSEKIVRSFSGGMKRKLSVAVAMFTGANNVFLDEPSTGMDPFARRALWKVIHSALGNRHSVLLTTHSMEEADAVCSRIGIITDGTLKCIGNSQHLKNRFGGGYVLTVTVQEGFADNVYEVDRIICTEAFPGAVLNEALGLQRKYNLGSIPSLSKAFGDLERNHTRWHLEGYGLAQTSSLEQIFLRFVGQQQLVD